jgi:hypothetical protein
MVLPSDLLLSNNKGGHGLEHQQLFDLKEAGESHIHNGHFCCSVSWAGPGDLDCAYSHDGLYYKEQDSHVHLEVLLT